MIEKLLQKSQILISNTNIDFIRDFYYKIDWQNKLIGIVGQRGIGKTTILLQYLKKEQLSKAIYFSADNIILFETGLYKLVEDLYFNHSIRNFFIDEIHKYKNWNQELKNLYDDFPYIKIVFSGSSSLDLIKGKYDLSRRVLLYKMKGFSFREYVNKTKSLNLKSVSLEEILQNPLEKVNEIYSTVGDEILSIFNAYLKIGYYPFSFESDKEESFFSKLFEALDKLVYEDISNFYKLDTSKLENIKKIIIFFSLAKPGKLSINSLKDKLGVSFDTVANYLQILNDSGIIKSIYVDGNISKSIRKAKKIYIDNSNLVYTISKEFGFNPEIGTIREIFFVSNFSKNLFYSEIGDFSYKLGEKNYFFEIGGKNKTKKQLKNEENSFIVADSIIFPEDKKIPIWLFGFLEN